MSGPALTEKELDDIRRQAEREYPGECCGVVLRREGARADRRLIPCRNIQNAKHAEDPVRFPRDARTAYYMHPEDVSGFFRLEGEGYALAVIYHSHIDVGAYFSETDRRRALEFGTGGQPAYPDATYVVVSVREGRAEDARAFRWSAAAGDFVEIGLGGEDDPIDGR
jgi:proteasome lid subunit RPN8/RPN11